MLLRPTTLIPCSADVFFFNSINNSLLGKCFLPRLLLLDGLLSKSAEPFQHADDFSKAGE